MEKDKGTLEICDGSEALWYSGKKTRFDSLRTVFLFFSYLVTMYFFSKSCRFLFITYSNTFFSPYVMTQEQFQDSMQHLVKER